MADVTFSDSCVNLEAGSRACHLTGKTCPFAPGREGECTDCRYVAKVVAAPDEFHVLVDSEHRPKSGRFAVKRCRAIEVHDAAGVHISTLLSCDTPRSLLHATRLSEDTVQLTTEEDGSVRWHAGRFIPA